MGGGGVLILPLEGKLVEDVKRFSLSIIDLETCRIKPTMRKDEEQALADKQTSICAFPLFSLTRQSHINGEKLVVSKGYSFLFLPYVLPYRISLYQIISNPGGSTQGDTHDWMRVRISIRY